MNSFETNIAMDVGINAAILYQNIHYWCQHNQANKVNEHEGLYWTYNSMKAFAELFPYLSEAQVRQALKVLEQKGYIKTGYFNKQAYDRTKWYADLRLQSEESSDCICYPSQMDMIQEANGFDTQGEPIPYINTDINANDNGISIVDKPLRTRFIPPTLEEVQEYCDERGNDVDAQKFLDYYSSNGWKVGRNPMKDWKAAVRTWERNSYGKPLNQVSRPKQTGNEFANLAQSMED